MNNSTRSDLFRIPPTGRDHVFNLSRSFYYRLEKAGKLKVYQLSSRGDERGAVFVSTSEIEALIRGHSTSAPTPANENPWHPDHRNLTRQAEILKTNPELAETLKAEIALGAENPWIVKNFSKQAEILRDNPEDAKALMACAESIKRWGNRV